MVKQKGICTIEDLAKENRGVLALQKPTIYFIMTFTLSSEEGQMLEGAAKAIEQTLSES